MAQRRMFSLKVVDTDEFLEMPQTTQLLYFHLAMRADDDGFVNSPRKIMIFSGSKQDDMKILKTKQFILPFQSGVIVIRHWKENNKIRKDRKTDTIYKEELSLLTEDPAGIYTVVNDVNQVSTKCPHRLGKDRIGKVSIGKDISYLPEIKEIIEYFNKYCNTNYRYSSKETQKLIKTRLNQSFTVSDFKKVINKKYAQWKDDKKMSVYIRPGTLFGPKFETYLNEVVKVDSSYCATTEYSPETEQTAEQIAEQERIVNEMMGVSG